MRRSTPDEQNYDTIDPTGRVAELIGQALTGRAIVQSDQNRPAHLTIQLDLDQAEDHELWLVPGGRQPHDRLAEDSGYSDEVLVLNGDSTDTHDRLRAQMVSFVDLGRGVVFLNLTHLLIDRTNLGRPRSQRIMGDAFAGKRQLVLYAMLSGPTDRSWTITQLAEASGVHVATASRAVRLLAQQSLVRDELPGQGRSSAVHVIDSRRLLVAWAERSSLEKNKTVRVEVAMGAPARFLGRLPHLMRHPAAWALTGQAGASLLATHAFFEDVFMYVDVRTIKDLYRVARAAGWQPSPSGNVHLMIPKVPDLIWPHVQLLQDVPVASTIQLVLDLWNYPLRGREQAEHLINTVMAPQWRKRATQ